MKTTNTPKGKAKKRPASKSRKKLVLTIANKPALRHFRLVGHKHTFKLIHHRHTSHLALMVVLLVVGFFIYASGDIVNAQTSSSSVLVGTIVPGPPPDIGATITSPTDNTTIKDQNIIDISGSCFSNSFVIIKSNSIVVGSTACSNAGIFSLQVQLEVGKNILTALNYDNLNQAGPVTPAVTIFVTQTVVDNTPIVSNNVISKPTQIFTPIIPDNPSIITGISTNISSCNEYNPGSLPTGGEPHVSIVCIPRLFFPKIEQVMGVIVWGGTPPYALSIDFGDDADHQTSLLSLSSPGYTKVKFSYAIPDTYRVKFMVTDKDDKKAIVQTSVQVNGQTESPISSFTKDILGGKPWYESPVPFYLLAIAITLGFWGGDIFDRKFGASKHKSRKIRAT